MKQVLEKTIERIRAEEAQADALLAAAKAEAESIVTQARCEAESRIRNAEDAAAKKADASLRETQTACGEAAAEAEGALAGEAAAIHELAASRQETIIQAVLSHLF